jgi:hypothetical protein
MPPILGSNHKHHIGTFRDHYNNSVRRSYFRPAKISTPGRSRKAYCVFNKDCLRRCKGSAKLNVESIRPQQVNMSLRYFLSVELRKKRFFLAVLVSAQHFFLVVRVFVCHEKTERNEKLSPG